MKKIDEIRMDKTIASSFNMKDEDNTAEFWAGKTAQECLMAAEFLRRQWMSMNNFSDEIKKIVSFKPLHD